MAAAKYENNQNLYFMQIAKERNVECDGERILLKAISSGRHAAFDSVEKFAIVGAYDLWVAADSCQPSTNYAEYPV